MIKTLTKTLSISLLLITSAVSAEPFMSKAQYSDYSVLYQCANIKFHDDLEQKEDALMTIENRFGINDDTFDAFDELITEYERDDALLDTIRGRAATECTVNIAKSD